MPIVPPPGLKRLSDDAFSKAVYAVMEVIFAIHNEFGRLFEEEIYRREIARRLVHVRTQVVLEAAFDTFRKAYYLAGEQSGLKTVDVLSDGKSIGTQEFKLMTPDSAFKITAFEGERPQYPMALRLLLEHTALNHLHWINIGRRLVTFKTFSK